MGASINSRAPPPPQKKQKNAPPVAKGLESVATPLDRLPTPVAGAGGAGAGRQKAAIAAAEEAFASSDLLRAMRERTAANAGANKKAIADKYCYRQAELGIGDCGGLRYVAGATKSGKQKTPKLMLKMLGKTDEEADAIRALQSAQEEAAAAAKGVGGGGGE